jgi:PAS domain S-box-containing protein
VFADDLTGNYLMGPDGTIIDCNAAFLTIFGFRTRREARATNMATLWGEADGQAAFVRLVQSRRMLASQESLRRRRDGLLFQAVESAVGEFDPQGCLLRIHGRLVDDAAGQLATRARREAEESYCDLLRALPDAILVADAEGRIVFANPVAADLLGAERADSLLGRSLRQFLAPAGGDGPDEVGGTATLRQIVRLDSRAVEVEMLQVPIQFDGSLCTLQVFRDITSRLRAEQARRDLERALAVSATKIEKLNDALTTVLEHREQESQRQLAGVRATLEQLVLAHLAHLKTMPLGPDQRTILEVIEANLRDVTSSFARDLDSESKNLTPTELQIADLLRQGKRTKDIARLLRVTHSAVTFHRNNIRAKLGLTRRPINLVSYLRTMTPPAPAPGGLYRRPRPRLAYG